MPTESPAAANRIGNRPQARPSLRLLTSPAWLADDSAGSRKLVWSEHLPVGELAVQVVVAAVGAGVWLAASRRAWPRVSRTNRVDRPRPSAAKATPR